MTLAEYRKTRAGAKVRTRMELRNGLMIIPAGTECVVYGKHGGFELTSPPCEHCGVSVRISKVQAYEVDLVQLQEG